MSNVKSLKCLKVKAFICILVLALLPFCSLAAAETYEASYTPWSGWWWPVIEGELVTGYRSGERAPFEKYDYVTSGTYYGPATQYGWNYYYDPSASSWHGLCLYWAAAAILEEEPVHTGLYQGNTFFVGDKKGILTAAYDGVLTSCHYDYQADGPTEFHRVLEEFIRDQRTPIIMDLANEGEAWNYPVFKYTTNYTQEGNIRHYTTTVYYPTDAVSPDYVGSMLRSKKYYYYFQIEGENIIASGWEGQSFANPPRYAREPFLATCRNPGIDHQQVLAIVTTNDDSYEDNDSLEAAAVLSSGCYRLIALDKDFFKVFLKPANKLKIWVTAEQDGEVAFRTYDSFGRLIQETTGSGEQEIAADTPGYYTVEVFPVDASQEPIYSLVFQQELQYQGIFPLAQAGSAWLNTIGLINPPKNQGRVIVSLIGSDGLPEKSYYRESLFAYLAGEAGADFDLLPTTTNTSRYFRIDADFDVKGGERVESKNYLCMGSKYFSESDASSVLYYPHIAFQGGWKTFAGIINLGNEAEEVLFQSFDENGEVLRSDTVEIASGQKIEYEAVYMSVFSPDVRSMTASTVSGRQSLIGYLQFHFGSKGRALIPLPLMRDNNLIISHIASNQLWSTGMVILNTGENNASIIINAYDAGGQFIASVGTVLKPGQNLVRTAAQLFGRGSSVASIRVVSNQPLAGFMLYTPSYCQALAGIPAIEANFAGTPLHLLRLDSSGGWLTGIAILNNSDISSATVSFSLFDEEGENVGNRTFNLNPYQRMAATLKNIFDADIPEEARYLEIDAAGGQPLSGLFISSSPDGFKMMGEVLE